jgi:hypothetical protein
MKVSASREWSAGLMALLMAGFGSTCFTHSAFGQTEQGPEPLSPADVVAEIEALKQEVAALEDRIAALEEASGEGLGSTIAGSIVRLDCSAGLGACIEVPLAGALVGVQGTSVIGETDAQGIYQLTGVPQGVWTIAVTAPASAISSSSNVAECVVWGIEPNVETAGDPAEIVTLDPMRPALVTGCTDSFP